MPCIASDSRYDGTMPYRQCGAGGLKLPLISLGLRHNFGGVDILERGRAIVPGDGYHLIIYQHPNDVRVTASRGVWTGPARDK